MHVEEYLFRERERWVSRKEVNESLEKAFPNMSSPLFRSKVFQNGHLHKRFFIARGPFGQTVGLTEQVAQDSLEVMTKAVREELTWSLDGNLTSFTKPITKELAVEEKPSKLAEGVVSGGKPQVGGENEGEVVQNKQAANDPTKPDGESLDPTPNCPGTSTTKQDPILNDTSDDGGQSAEVSNESPDVVTDQASNSDGDISEWDAESIDSAVIDARLQSRMCPATDAKDSPDTDK